MEEKPRSTDEKMERRAGINRPSAYKKRRKLNQNKQQSSLRGYYGL
jgi:acetyl-CoA carboxylase alpha subunit